MTNEKKFIDLVNDIIQTLDLANDRAGALRDAVEGEQQKDVFNYTRGILQTQLLPAWREFRDGIPESQANKTMGKGWTGRCKWPEDD